MNYRTKQLTSGQHLEGAVPYLKGSHSTLGERVAKRCRLSAMQPEG